MPEPSASHFASVIGRIWLLSLYAYSNAKALVQNSRLNSVSRTDDHTIGRETKTRRHLPIGKCSAIFLNASAPS